MDDDASDDLFGGPVDGPDGDLYAQDGPDLFGTEPDELILPTEPVPAADPEMDLPLDEMSEIPIDPDEGDPDDASDAAGPTWSGAPATPSAATSAAASSASAMSAAPTTSTTPATPTDPPVQPGHTTPDDPHVQLTEDRPDAPLALYRRYRPDTFADVIGQEHVTDPLQRALHNNRVNHAYLFSGPRGCGKTSSARILARCLNCEQGPTPTPCGHCRSCRDLARGGAGSIDVIEMDAATHGLVEDARSLRERAFFSPVHSRYKIYIIDEAHMVTPQGFNALLKVVEEPPPHVKFIFATTEPEKVLGTIRSRTHHYPFRLIPPKTLASYLARLCEAEGVRVDPAVLPLVVRAGAGSVRDSLSVLDQLLGSAGEAGVSYRQATGLLGYTPDTLLDEIVDAFAAGDAEGVFACIDKVIEVGQDPRRFAEDLLRRLRDLIIVAAVPDALASGLVDVSGDQGERLTVQANGLGPGELTRAAEVIASGLTEMRGTTAPRLHLELMCARVLLPGADVDGRGVHARLDRIERRLSIVGVEESSSVQRVRTPSVVSEPSPRETTPTHGRRSTELDSSPGGVAGSAGSDASRPAGEGTTPREQGATHIDPGSARGDVPRVPRSSNRGTRPRQTQDQHPVANIQDSPRLHAAHPHDGESLHPSAASAHVPPTAGPPSADLPEPPGWLDEPPFDTPDGPSGRGRAQTARDSVRADRGNPRREPGPDAHAATESSAGHPTADAGPMPSASAAAPQAPRVPTSAPGPIITQPSPAPGRPAPASSAPAAAIAAAPNALPRQAEEGASDPGSFSTADLRRVWPQVLDAVKGRRRVTWIGLQQNTQVHKLADGVLTLSVDNPGVFNMLTRGGSDDIIREALLQVIGIAPQIVVVTSEADALALTGSSRQRQSTPDAAGAAPASTGWADRETVHEGVPGPDAAGPDAAGPDAAGSAVAGPDAAGSDVAGPDAAGSDVARGDSNLDRARTAIAPGTGTQDHQPGEAPNSTAPGASALSEEGWGVGTSMASAPAGTTRGAHLAAPGEAAQAAASRTFASVGLEGPGSMDASAEASSEGGSTGSRTPADANVAQRDADESAPPAADSAASNARPAGCGDADPTTEGTGTANPSDAAASADTISTAHVRGANRPSQSASPANPSDAVPPTRNTHSASPPGTDHWEQSPIPPHRVPSSTRPSGRERQPPDSAPSRQAGEGVGGDTSGPTTAGAGREGPGETARMPPGETARMPRVGEPTDSQRRPDEPRRDASGRENRARAAALAASRASIQPTRLGRDADQEEEPDRNDPDVVDDVTSPDDLLRSVLGAELLAEEGSP